MAMLHSHLYEHSLQGIAATISLANLLIATLRYNERQTGRAVSLLVGIPFLFTNISVRLIGFSLLFAYFDTLWVLLFLGLHFCVAAIAVQLGSGQTACGRVCRYRKVPSLSRVQHYSFTGLHWGFLGKKGGHVQLCRGSCSGKISFTSFTCKYYSDV